MLLPSLDYSRNEFIFEGFLQSVCWRSHPQSFKVHFISRVRSFTMVKFSQFTSIHVYPWLKFGQQSFPDRTNCLISTLRRSKDELTLILFNELLNSCSLSNVWNLRRLHLRLATTFRRCKESSLVKDQTIDLSLQSLVMQNFHF